MRFPTIKADGYVGMRYASDLNDWIDFVVLVPKGCEDADKVNAVMDEFWDDDGLSTAPSYGDLIEMAFPEAIILYHDDEDESEAWDARWEEMLRNIDWFWVNR